ncbi:hypothetical protein Goari_002241 [Gossypium aridum]|uniref:TF-B3 domain-containing protein n=1 Tax=Gossypium aridum TaxID=34290 RepID=A0A7J8Y9F7_GOSAI|nr:hypothetical protein [Gossypium aridum]
MEDQEQGRRTFSKRLTPIEVEKRIILFFYTVVAEFFEFEEGRHFFMDVTDNLGKEWTFVGTFHANNIVENHVSISWAQFSLEKGLKVNDEVTFTEKPQGNGPWKKFKVVIKRKIRLFGQDIWGELMV